MSKSNFYQVFNHWRNENHYKHTSKLEQISRKYYVKKSFSAIVHSAYIGWTKVISHSHAKINMDSIVISYTYCDTSMQNLRNSL